MEASQMTEQWKVIGLLDRLVDKVREGSHLDHDIQTEAYISGKADGLALASNILRSISRNLQIDNDHIGLEIHA